MTPKEKADYLIEKNYQLIIDLVDVNNAFYYSKNCALSAVELVLSTNEDESIYGTEFKKYWEQVKIELEKL